MFGYRTAEILGMPILGEIKANTFFVLRKLPVLFDRPVAAVSMGCHACWMAMPRCDLSCVETMLAGVCKRFAAKPPTADQEIMEEFRLFVEDWIRSNLLPLSPGHDITFPTWLDKTHYPQWRKDQLSKIYLAGIPIGEEFDHYFCGSFGKPEPYPSYKYERGINARSDNFKIEVGPIFKAIEEVLFALPWFIKHIPVDERADYLMDMLSREGARVFTSDHTTFEAMFVAQMMEMCEFQLYEYMTSGLPEGPRFMRLIREVLAGTNVCKYKGFTVWLEATRMSGEMCTSLGNGFSNLMLMLFHCKRIGSTCVAGVVEGDDGVFICSGRFPTKEEFALTGANVKCATQASLSTSDFCGMIFDEEERILVTDPLEVLANFGWTSRQYCSAGKNKLKMLLRSKSLSYAYQYPGCPIIESLAAYGMRVTSGYDVTSVVEKDRTMSMWEREQLIEALMSKLPRKTTGIRTRLLVESRYNIPIDRQLAFEAYLDSKNDLSPIDTSLIIDLVPPSWRHFFDTYISSLQLSEMAHPLGPQLPVYAGYRSMVEEYKEAFDFDATCLPLIDPTC